MLAMVVTYFSKKTTNNENWNKFETKFGKAKLFYESRKLKENKAVHFQNCV